MTLRKKLEKQGNWLFKWRSYLPLFILPVLFIALRESEYLERVFGDTIEDFYDVLCLLISFAGLAVRCITVGFVPAGTSGRNTKKQKAEVLNTKGMYSIVRHPLYLGNFFIFLGITLSIQVWWFTILFVLAFLIYYERIMFAEEEFLRGKFQDIYLQWAEKTPAFLPDIRNWKQPSIPFSFRNVLKREYTGFFIITASFFFLDIMTDFFTEGKLGLDLGWLILFTVGLIIYLALRTLKKKTKILDVDGR